VPQNAWNESHATEQSSNLAKCKGFYGKGFPTEKGFLSIESEGFLSKRVFIEGFF
jgi:hypothetical protein